MFFYNILLNILCLPVILIILIISIFNVRLRRTLLCRMGFNKIERSEKQPVWFHCSSLGEFNAIKNVIIDLKRQYNEIFITTLTDTGYHAAGKFLGYHHVSILPLDFNFFIRIMIKKINPLLLVIEETEVWPNLIYQAKRLNIPVLYTNCIISERSYKFYRFMGCIFKRLLKGIDIFFVQNQSTGQYLLKLGINKIKIRYSGNIKFDINIEYNRNSEKIKKIINLNNKFIITAGSTRKGEEKILLHAFRILKNNYPQLHLIIAPRHLDRIKEISELIVKYNLEYSFYSRLKKYYDVLLIDKMGVLMDMYFISQISFIGGTLVPVGGHNPLEAASVKKPVFFGKYIKNNKEAFMKIMENKGGFMIHNEKELLIKFKMLINDRKMLMAMGKNAYKVLKENQGASGRITRYLKKNYLPN